MAGNIYIGEIIANEEIQEDCFLMKVRTHSSFENPLPGQFVMVRIAGLNDPFLSRPISIYSFTRETNYCTIELLYRVVGKGTQVMAGLIEGSYLEINGPLGNGFETENVKENIVLISGGIGIAPLSMLMESLRRTARRSSAAIMMYTGFQNKTAVVGLDKMRGACRDVSVCTDDGTLGSKGFVTQIFEKDMKNFTPENTSIYVCGPREMLKALAKILNKSKFDCQVSLEERMACGTGACMGCAVAVKDKEGAFAYKRVCADGPVFNLSDIIWD
ncbi:MAG TPA: dihydroorotate dehydrogenase electron transfer subunit [Smithella sp.]|jgi:dihydroorotate dehydrogenase electron transfer subunit|nr:dihydroorotate dehydrogenase electron transfer subunit [Smithella sp.]HOX99650.1 dihydroorotate dehydrogenase electron transfer subunit [Smithella sp.]HPN87178.1 dihydroorotate dehydrogenase electron transfer subunit [Smithella sp.]